MGSHTVFRIMQRILVSQFLKGIPFRLTACCVANQCWSTFRTTLWQSECATATVERNVYKICSSSAELLTHRAGSLEPSDSEASAGVKTSKHGLDSLFNERRKEFILRGYSAQIDRHERPCRLACIWTAEEGSSIRLRIDTSVQSILGFQCQPCTLDSS